MEIQMGKWRVWYYWILNIVHLPWHQLTTHHITQIGIKRGYWVTIFCSTFSQLGQNVGWDPRAMIQFGRAGTFWYSLGWDRGALFCFGVDLFWDNIIFWRYSGSHFLYFRQKTCCDDYLSQTDTFWWFADLLRKWWYTLTWPFRCYDLKIFDLTSFVEETSGLLCENMQMAGARLQEGPTF